MNSDIVFRLAQGMNQGEDPRVLGTIAMEGIAVAVGTRGLPADFHASLDELPEEHFPSIDTLVMVQHVEQAVTAACDIAGTPISRNRQLLCQDVAVLAQMFAKIVQEPFLRLRLENFKSLASEKFHMGNVRARLFCSYRGVEVDFGAAEVNGIPKQSQRLPCGMPAIFRGLLWHGIELSRVVYRPVPAQRPGDIGFLLTIDPANNARHFSS